MIQMPVLNKGEEEATFGMGKNALLWNIFLKNSIKQRKCHSEFTTAEQ